MPPTFDQRLAKLRALDPTSPRAIGELRTVLGGTQGLLVAVAAKLVGEHLLAALADDLPPAFERLLVDGVKRDPACRAKIAIVHALYALDRWDDRVFVAGLRHVQPEGFTAGDTAAPLRGLCGLAHVQFLRDDAIDVLATLLADPERAARLAAAQGLPQTGAIGIRALLRYKLLAGDDEPEVLAACVEGLLDLSRDSALPFILELLAEHDDRGEVAALALGGARIAEAFEPLRVWCMGCRPAQRHRVGYLAIALLRSDRGTAYLLETVAASGSADALAAAQALATFKEDTELAERIRAAARDHKDAQVRREVEALLASRS